MRQQIGGYGIDRKAYIKAILRDGLGRQEDTGIVYGTNVVCRYLNQETCQCREYQQRSVLVPECVTLSPDNLEQVYYMPNTCAYRLLAEQQKLPLWHPLMTGDKDSTHSSGHSVRGKVISEDDTDDLMHHLTGEWY